MSRPKAGDILQLDLGDGQKGYVQVSEAGLLIAFDVMTPADLAPEVLKGRYQTECDMWSLGVVV